MKYSLCIVFALIIGVSTSSSWGQEKVDPTSPKQETDRGKDSTEKESSDNLLPIRYLHHDGSSFFYQGNCCETDGGGGNSHSGLVISAEKLTVSTCATSDPSDRLPRSKMLGLPPAFGNGNTGLDLPIVLTGNFATKLQADPIAGFDQTAFTLQNYYGGPRLMTSVRLKDAGGKTRVFTFAKCRIIADAADGSPKEVDFPILTLSRVAPDIVQKAGNFPQTIVPIKQLHEPGGFLVPNIQNLDQAQVDIVEIEVPDPNDPTKNKTVKCLMVNRKLP